MMSSVGGSEWERDAPGPLPPQPSDRIRHRPAMPSCRLGRSLTITSPSWIKPNSTLASLHFAFHVPSTLDPSSHHELSDSPLSAASGLESPVAAEALHVVPPLFPVALRAHYSPTDLEQQAPHQQPCPKPPVHHPAPPEEPYCHHRPGKNFGMMGLRGGTPPSPLIPSSRSTARRRPSMSWGRATGSPFVAFTPFLPLLRIWPSCGLLPFPLSRRDAAVTTPSSSFLRRWIVDSIPLPRLSLRSFPALRKISPPHRNGSNHITQILLPGA